MGWGLSIWFSVGGGGESRFTSGFRYKTGDVYGSKETLRRHYRRLRKCQGHYSRRSLRHVSSRSERDDQEALGICKAQGPDEALNGNGPRRPFPSSFYLTPPFYFCKGDDYGTRLERSYCRGRGPRIARGRRP